MLSVYPHALATFTTRMTGLFLYLSSFTSFPSASYIYKAKNKPVIQLHETKTALPKRRRSKLLYTGLSTQVLALTVKS